MDVTTKNSDSLQSCFNLSSFEEKDISIFLYTIFQYYMEKTTSLINEANEDSLAKAKYYLNSLLDNSFMNTIKSKKIAFNSINGLILFNLGKAHWILGEKNEALKTFKSAIDHFNTLPTIFKLRYINVYQEAFNYLGILMYNSDKMKQAMEYLAKADQMYNVFCEMKSVNSTSDFREFFSSFFSEEEQPQSFKFFIDGGLDKAALERNHIYTFFYYAQSYLKLGFRNKGTRYVCFTLKKKVELNEYELEEAVENCLVLCTFFSEFKHFAQVEYLLLAALKLVEREPKNKEIKAKVNKELGCYYLQRLIFAVEQIHNQVWIEEDDELKTKVHSKTFSFDNLSIKWPKIEDITDLEQAKSLFRLGNTQFKHALEYFKMDGFVSDHIEINQYTSQLYRQLCEIEKSESRILGMLERRNKLLASVFEDINFNVYPVQWQELTSELIEVAEKIFAIKVEDNKIEANYWADRAISLNNTLIEVFSVNDIEKLKADESFSYAKILVSSASLTNRKIAESSEQKRDFLIKALSFYEKAREVMSACTDTPTEELLELQTIVDDTVSMLPVKIDNLAKEE